MIGYSSSSIIVKLVQREHQHKSLREPSTHYRKKRCEHKCERKEGELSIKKTKLEQHDMDQLSATDNFVLGSLTLEDSAPTGKVYRALGKEKAKG